MLPIHFYKNEGARNFCIRSSRVYASLLAVSLAFGSNFVLADTSVATESRQYSIAFLPDVHFHDVHGVFSDNAFSGIESATENQAAVLRTMQAQLHSTRLFNENYFAFIAALDDLVERGVTLVALPGDFSDDGQPIHLRGLAKILKTYEEKHGMRFLLTTGNHDPVRPFDFAGGKSDFLGPEGQPISIFSLEHDMCLRNADAATSSEKDGADICSDELVQLGYQGIFEHLGQFGMQPHPDDFYWETPYSHHTGQYQYEKALATASLDARNYEVCHQGAASMIKNGSNCVEIIDASYLVEPIEGLWVLAIDANIYQPAETPAGVSQSGANFASSGNAGYNQMQRYKPQVLEWVEDVVKRAEDAGKTLIAFSHYPIVDFYNGMSPQMAELFGERSFQLARVPQTEVSQAVAATGLKIHVGGHMHFNHTSVVQAPEGNRLVNIQAPSLAGYRPAYKLLTTYESGFTEVETVKLTDVPGFDTFFPLYRREYQAHLEKHGVAPWPEAILHSKTYADLTEWHLKELARQRFLPREWPQEVRDMLLSSNAAELFELVNANIPPDIDQNWSGLDLAVDFYRIRNAGTLGLQEISEARMLAYESLYAAVKDATTVQAQPNAAVAEQLERVLFIMQGLQMSPESDHFWISAEGTVIPYMESVN